MERSSKKSPLGGVSARAGRPLLRRWKTRDLAYATYEGRRFYLGKWGSTEAARAYYMLLAKNDAGLDPTESEEREPPTLAELAVAFFEARKDYYVKNGKQTNQLQRFKAALEYPLALYPDLPVDKFGPLKMISCRDAMERSGRYARQYINALVNCLRGVFKFGVERELVRPETLQALQAVAPLKRGRSLARERVPVRPVPAADVEKTLEFLSPTVGAMVRVQRHTGMRPGEVCSMRVGDFVRDGDVLVYMPRTDKTDWRREIGDFKRIPLGPKAQAILVPYLLEKEDDRDAYLFSPIDAERDQVLMKRENRKTPITKQTRDRDALKKRRRLNPCYDSNSYRRAVERAADRAGVPRWTPNQLRHLYATEIRSKYGLEVSQIMLGHANANVTQIYAERDFHKAAEVALREG